MTFNIELYFLFSDAFGYLLFSTAKKKTKAFAKVRDKIGIPLATGQWFATKWAFTELLARNLVDIVQPETTRLGGITELKKLAAMAEAQSVTVAPHDGSVGPIIEMANVHVLASIPNCFFWSTKQMMCRGGWR